jgi:hypothetical protein
MSLPTNTKSMKSTCQNHEECMKMVQMILDGEASAEQVEHFKTHNLKECMPCIDSFKLEQEIRSALQVKAQKR